MIMVGLGSSAMVLGGLGLLVLAPAGLWSRLLGLQWLAMGLYLLLLVRLKRVDVLRPLMPARLPLALAALLIGLPWLALAELVWSVGAWLSLSGPPGGERLRAPSVVHNTVLGLFPLGEGLAVLVLAGPVSSLLYQQPAVQPWATLFALQSLFLGVFWWACVWRACWSGLAVTILGRLVVAGCFASLWLGGASERLGLLSLALVGSCVWSAWEGLRRPS